MFGDRMVTKGMILALNGKEVDAVPDVFDLVVSGDGVVEIDITVVCEMTDEIQEFIRNRGSLEFGIVLINEATADYEDEDGGSYLM